MLNLNTFEFMMYFIIFTTKIQRQFSSFKCPVLIDLELYVSVAGSADDITTPFIQIIVLGTRMLVCI